MGVNYPLLANAVTLSEPAAATRDFRLARPLGLWAAAAVGWLFELLLALCVWGALRAAIPLPALRVTGALPIRDMSDGSNVS